MAFLEGLEAREIAPAVDDQKTIFGFKVGQQAG
jgi:hypothetical protein